MAWYFWQWVVSCYFPLSLSHALRNPQDENANKHFIRIAKGHYDLWTPPDVLRPTDVQLWAFTEQVILPVPLNRDIVNSSDVNDIAVGGWSGRMCYSSLLVSFCVGLWFRCLKIVSSLHLDSLEFMYEHGKHGCFFFNYLAFQGTRQMIDLFNVFSLFSSTTFWYFLLMWLSSLSQIHSFESMSPNILRKYSIW